MTILAQGGDNVKVQKILQNNENSRGRDAEAASAPVDNHLKPEHKAERIYLIVEADAKRYLRGTSIKALSVIMSAQLYSRWSPVVFSCGYQNRFQE